MLVRAGSSNTSTAGRPGRLLRLLVSPWARFGVLVALLAAGIALAVAWEPQRLLTHGWPPQTWAPPPY